MLGLLCISGDLFECFSVVCKQDRHFRGKMNELLVGGGQHFLWPALFQLLLLLWGEKHGSALCLGRTPYSLSHPLEEQSLFGPLGRWQRVIFIAQFAVCFCAEGP